MDEFVITGMGTITPLGNAPETVWERLLRNEQALVPSVWASVPLIAPCGFNMPGTPLDRSIQMAVQAAQKALADAGESFPLDSETGVFVSSTKGGMNSFANAITRTYLENLMPDGAARVVARFTGAKGVCRNVVAACATGIFAFRSAMLAIRAGECERALVGVAESALTELVLSGFANMGILCRKPPVPFRKNREGFAPGEGAAVFTLEKRTAARKRGAVVYGRIRATAAITDDEHVVRFDATGRAIARAIRTVITEAGVEPGQVDAVCVHGTATLNNDLCEANGIKSVLRPDIPCFGVKPALGHLLGASAAIELMVCLSALRNGVVPSTLGAGEIDAGCALSISQSSRAQPLNLILSLNFGFGGHVGAILISKDLS